MATATLPPGTRTKTLDEAESDPWCGYHLVSPKWKETTPTLTTGMKSAKSPGVTYNFVSPLGTPIEKVFPVSLKAISPVETLISPVKEAYVLMDKAYVAAPTTTEITQKGFAPAQWPIPGYITDGHTDTRPYKVRVSTSVVSPTLQTDLKVSPISFPAPPLRKRRRHSKSPAQNLRQPQKQSTPTPRSSVTPQIGSVTTPTPISTTPRVPLQECLAPGLPAIDTAKIPCGLNITFPHTAVQHIPNICSQTIRNHNTEDLFATNTDAFLQNLGSGAFGAANASKSYTDELGLEPIENFDPSKETSSYSSLTENFFTAPVREYQTRLSTLPQKHALARYSLASSTDSTHMDKLRQTLFDIQGYLPNLRSGVLSSLLETSYPKIDFGVLDIFHLSLIGHMFQNYGYDSITRFTEQYGTFGPPIIRPVGNLNDAIVDAAPLLQDNMDKQWSYIVPFGYQIIFANGYTLSGDDKGLFDDVRGKIWAMPHPLNSKIYVRIVFGGPDGFQHYDNETINSIIFRHFTIVAPAITSQHSSEATLLDSDESTLLDIDPLIAGELKAPEVIADDVYIEEDTLIDDDSEGETLVDFEEDLESEPKIRKGLTLVPAGTNVERSNLLGACLPVSGSQANSKVAAVSVPLKQSKKRNAEAMESQEPTSTSNQEPKVKKARTKPKAAKSSYPDIKVNGVTLSNSRRVPNCFLLYRTWWSQQARAKNPAIKNVEVSRLSSEAWKALPALQKAEWKERAAGLRNAHKESYPEYVYSPRKTDQIKRRRTFTDTIEGEEPKAKRCRIESQEEMATSNSQPRRVDIPNRKRKLEALSEPPIQSAKRPAPSRPCIRSEGVQPLQQAKSPYQQVGQQDWSHQKIHALDLSFDKLQQQTQHCHGYPPQVVPGERIGAEITNQYLGYPSFEYPHMSLHPSIHPAWITNSHFG